MIHLGGDNCSVYAYSYAISCLCKWHNYNLSNESSHGLSCVATRMWIQIMAESIYCHWLFWQKEKSHSLPPPPARHQNKTVLSDSYKLSSILHEKGNYWQREIAIGQKITVTQVLRFKSLVTSWWSHVKNIQLDRLMLDHSDTLNNKISHKKPMMTHRKYIRCKKSMKKVLCPSLLSVCKTWSFLKHVFQTKIHVSHNGICLKAKMNLFHSITWIQCCLFYMQIGKKS